jgi:predicted AAA+ superfamily ATPase
LKVQPAIIPKPFYAAFIIPRTLTPILKNPGGQYPVVTITGPRQSGKTTLCRETFPSKGIQCSQRQNNKNANAFVLSDKRENSKYRLSQDRFSARQEAAELFLGAIDDACVRT